jgi:hypothetical protein
MGLKQDFLPKRNDILSSAFAYKDASPHPVDTAKMRAAVTICFLHEAHTKTVGE